MSEKSLGDEKRGVELERDATRLLARWRAGDDETFEELVALVYDELRRLAGRYLHHENAGQTLEPLDLVHEAFLRLIGQRHVDWRNRAHLLGVAAQMMRRILTDRGRRRSSARHGGGARRVILDDVPERATGDEAAVVEVDEALVELEEVDPLLAKIVELRFFGGLDHDEIAALLGVSNPTVRRRFRDAKTWLHRRLSSQVPGACDGSRASDRGAVRPAGHAAGRSGSPASRRGPPGSGLPLPGGLPRGSGPG